MNMLEFPRHISAKNADDKEIINLVKNFFDETMCLYNIINLEQLFDSLDIKARSKENFEVSISCKDHEVLEKLKDLYNNHYYEYYNTKIFLTTSSHGKSLIMDFNISK